jgi:hypothetical protein
MGFFLSTPATVKVCGRTALLTDRRPEVLGENTILMHHDLIEIRGIMIN